MRDRTLFVSWGELMSGAEENIAELEPIADDFADWLATEVEEAG